MPNLSKEEILMKLNSMGVKLINATYQHISLIKKKMLIMGKILKQYLLKTLIFNQQGTGGGGRKEYSFCGTPAKKLQNLHPAASKIVILLLRQHRDSQVPISIDTKL